MNKASPLAIRTFYDIEIALYKSQYKEAMEIIDEMPLSSKDSYYFYLLQGITLFNLVKLDKAYKAFRNALEYKDTDILAKLYLACVHLKSMKTDLALKQWLEVLEIDEKNSYAKRAISLLKRINESELPHLAQNMYRFKLLPAFLPAVIKRRRIRTIVFLGVLAACIAASIPFIPQLYGIAKNYVFPQNERSVLFAESSENNDAPNTATEILEYSVEDILQFPVRREFTAGEIRSTLRSIEKKFVQYRENEARTLINSLLYSNIDATEKQRLSFLLSNLSIPTFLSDLRWFSFAEMQDQLWKYHNVGVKWKGTVTQIDRMVMKEYAALEKLSKRFSQYEEVLQARFLLDFYGEHKELSAILPLYFTPELKLQNGDEVELLALLKFNEPALQYFDSLATEELDAMLLVLGFRYILE